MIFSRSASEFIHRRRKVLPFKRDRLPFAVMPKVAISRVIFPSSSVIMAVRDSTSASLARISWPVPSFAFRSNAFFACVRFCFFFLRMFCFSRMLEIVRSAIFLLCPEMKSVNSTVGNSNDYTTHAAQLLAVPRFVPSIRTPGWLEEYRTAPTSILRPIDDRRH